MRCFAVAFWISISYTMKPMNRTLPLIFSLPIAFLFFPHFSEGAANMDSVCNGEENAPSGVPGETFPRSMPSNFSVCKRENVR